MNQYFSKYFQRHCRLKHNGNIAIEIIGSGSDHGPSHKHNNENKRAATATSTPINHHSERKQMKFDGNANTNFSSKDLVSNSNINENINSNKNNNLSISQDDINVKVNDDDNNDDGIRLDNREVGAASTSTPPPPMLNKAKTKRYKCHNCPYVTDSKSQFLYHKSFHKPRGEPFQCSYCSYNVTKRHLLNQHIKMHIAENNKNESTDTSIKKSNEVEAIDLTTASSTRTVVVKRAADILDGHVPEVVNTNVERQIYFCNLCPARYLSLKEIKTHLNFHLEQNANKCEACTYSTANESYLNEHKIVHTTYYQEKTKEFLVKYKTNVDYIQPELKEVNDLKFTSEPYWIVPYKIGDLDDMIVSSIVPISKSCDVNANAKSNTDDVIEPKKITRQFLKINPHHQLKMKESVVQVTETNEINEDIPKFNELNEKNEIYEKCPYCPFSTTVPLNLKAHILHHYIVSGVECSFKCVHCDFSINDSIKLHEHCKLHFTALNSSDKVSLFTNYDNLKIGYYPAEQSTDGTALEDDNDNDDDEDNLDMNQLDVTDKSNDKFELVYDSDKIYKNLNEPELNDEKILINI